jgi:hypothetical protein
VNRYETETPAASGDRSQLETQALTSIRAHVKEEKKQGQIMEANVIFPKGKNHA